MIKHTETFKTTPNNFINWIDTRWATYRYKRLESGQNLWINDHIYLSINGRIRSSGWFKFNAELRINNIADGELKERYLIPNCAYFATSPINQELTEVRVWCESKNLDGIIEDLWEQWNDNFTERSGKSEPSEAQIYSKIEEEIIKPNCIFKRDGEIWHLEFEGKKKELPDISGLNYIHALLARPNVEIPSIELYRLINNITPEKILYGSGKKPNPGSEIIPGYDDGLSITDEDDFYPVLDAQAIIDYKKVLADLDLDLEALKDAGGDPADIDQIEYTKDTIYQALYKSKMQGNVRNLNITDVDKARQNITQAIKLAYTKIIQSPDEMVVLRRYLGETIIRGKYFMYKDDENVKWEL